jgi:hypothetical protein
MGFLKNLISSNKDDMSSEAAVDQGLLIFDSVNDVIHAEATLKKAAFADIKVVAPPPQYRTGCDLAIRFPIMERLGIERVLKDCGNVPRDIICVNEELMQPTEICSAKDFGRYLMVRSANMKITVEKETKMIVNISGGGCSDVPYLALELIGKTLDSASTPRQIGYTLCAYTLNIAFDEARRLLR